MTDQEQTREADGTYGSSLPPAPVSIAPPPERERFEPQVKLSPAELAEAERIGVSPADMLVVKRTRFYKAAADSGMDPAAYQRLVEATGRGRESGRGVNLREWEAVHRKG